MFNITRFGEALLQLIGYIKLNDYQEESRICLTKLKWYANCLLAITILAATPLAPVIFLQIPNWKLYTIFILAVTLTAAFYYERARRNVMAALLIMENQIMHFGLAVFDKQIESIEVFISCFGVLIGSRIIKFNQSGIRLKAVELGKDFVSLTYGTEKKTQNIKIFHAENRQCELTEVVRKFRYETGVVPVIEEMRA